MYLISAKKSGVIQGHFAVLYCLQLWIFAGKCWLVRSPIKLQSFSRLLQLNILGENKASFRYTQYVLDIILYIHPLDIGIYTVRLQQKSEI